MPKPSAKSVSTTFAALAFYGMTSAALAWITLDQLGILWLARWMRGKNWLVLPVVLVGAVLGMTKLNRLVHFLAAASFCLWLTVILTPFSGWLARPLKIESAPAPADAVVVLSSWMQPDGDFSNHAESRLIKGLELVHAKYAPRLVLTELPPPRDLYTKSAGEMAKRLGVDCPIETVGPVRDTHDEAELISRLARDKGWKRLLLVTSPTHTRRAVLTFRKAGLDVISTPCRETEYNLENPVRAEDRLRAFVEGVRERIGLLSYQWRGWA